MVARNHLMKYHCGHFKKKTLQTRAIHATSVQQLLARSASISCCKASQSLWIHPVICHKAPVYRTWHAFKRLLSGMAWTPSHPRHRSREPWACSLECQEKDRQLSASGMNRSLRINPWKWPVSEVMFLLVKELCSSTHPSLSWRVARCVHIDFG